MNCLRVLKDTMKGMVVEMACVIHNYAHILSDISHIAALLDVSVQTHYFPYSALSLSNDPFCLILGPLVHPIAGRIARSTSKPFYFSDLYGSQSVHLGA